MKVKSHLIIILRQIIIESRFKNVLEFLDGPPEVIIMDEVSSS